MAGARDDTELGPSSSGALRTPKLVTSGEDFVRRRTAKHGARNERRGGEDGKEKSLPSVGEG